MILCHQGLKHEKDMAKEQKERLIEKFDKLH